jgi:hypothetical protein
VCQRTAGEIVHGKKFSGDVFNTRINIPAETVFSDGQVKPVENQVTELLFEY